jgi:DNA-directed RNA polymerase specialized sigma24 family protein
MTDELQTTTPPRPPRQSKWEVDARRARALHGDPLEELSEKQREWIWRSLLKGIRLKEATRLAQITPQEVTQALDRVASQYTAYLAQQRALQGAPSAALPAAGRRPEAPPGALP